MTSSPSTITLLGPQRFKTTLHDVLEDCGVTGRVATITAGWQDREPNVEELEVEIPGEAVHLEMYRRAELLFVKNPELLNELRNWNDRLREAQRFYRIRLDYTLNAAQKLQSRPGKSALLVDARKQAIEAVVTLDAQHFATKSELLEGRAAVYRANSAVMDERAKMEALIDDTEAVLISGGHVAVLMNRLHLFGAPDLFGSRRLVAWSAGAMALSERIVLFHDSPPQGAGNAELMEPGLALCPGVVPLPHAHRRLNLHDKDRVSLFARRFAPAACVAMDDGSRLDWSSELGWTGHRGTMRLSESGRVERLGSGLIPEKTGSKR